MRNNITAGRRLQSPEYQAPPTTPSFQPHPKSWSQIPHPPKDDWTPVGSIVPEVLWWALEQAPPEKRAEGIEALAECGIYFAAERIATV